MTGERRARFPERRSAACLHNLPRSGAKPKPPALFIPPGEQARDDAGGKTRGKRPAETMRTHNILRNERSARVSLWARCLNRPRIPPTGGGDG